MKSTVTAVAAAIWSLSALFCSGEYPETPGFNCLFLNQILIVATPTRWMCPSGIEGGKGSPSRRPSSQT